MLLADSPRVVIVVPEVVGSFFLDVVEASLDSSGVFSAGGNVSSSPASRALTSSRKTPIIVRTLRTFVPLVPTTLGCWFLKT